MSKKFRRTTIQDVADRAGVSKSSVSRALNGSSEQNPETTQRILKIIDKLDYVPARSAQSLAHGRTLAVALLVPAGMWWEWTLEIMRGIHDELERLGMTLTLVSCGTDSGSQEALARRLTHSHLVDGLIAIIPSKMIDLLKRLESEGVSVVLIDESEDRPHFSAVRVDNRTGSHDGVKHLLATTEGKIAFLGEKNLPVSEQRLMGYKDALVSENRDVEATLIGFGDETVESGRMAMKRILDRHKDISAVFCSRDRLAVGALRAIQEAGYKVPDQVSILGFDDSEVVRATYPTISVVNQPLREVGTAAAKMMKAKLDGEENTDLIVLPTSLIERGTTKVENNKTKRQKRTEREG